MTIEDFEKDLAAGESVTVEFKSWIKAKDMRERISLAVEELIAFANTTDGKCLKRLGKNSKPYYPDEMSNKYSTIQNPDFSSQIIVESSLDDVNKLEVYSLKEKLRIRDPKSTLPDLEDVAFMRDLGAGWIIQIRTCGFLREGISGSLTKCPFTS